MRLLHTETLRLHEFFGSNIPPYAILSHTWGEDEVSFQELERGEGSGKAGHRKIRGCCNIAASDAFEYIWVDTCCIDKTSSAELSEAINSMYSWYRLSDVCYVYLADVSSNLGLKATEVAIRRSRWFTRGWTLQELIAPPSVIFYDAHWYELGTKDSLEILISKITRIDGRVLRDADEMEAFSIAQKMSWASMRITTRIEDIAYCLLGIFGVHMPMLYGEGHHAFIRLQEEIMKSTEDHSIFVWTSDIVPTKGLLAHTPAWFQHSGNIVHSQTPAFPLSPFSMTNKGIHLHLPVQVNHSSKQCLAVINCHEIEDDTKNLGIYLHRQAEGGNNFKRDAPLLLGEVDRAAIINLQQENVFVKQERVPIKVPVHGKFIISMNILQNNIFAFRQATPQLWSRIGDVLQLVPPFFVSGSTFNGVLFSAFEFAEVNSDYGFIVILKQGKKRALRELRGADQHEALCQISAKVVANLPSLENYICPTSIGCDKNDLLQAFLAEQSQLDFRTERIFWQHPVRKWWVKVTVKKQFDDLERAIVVHITCPSSDVMETRDTEWI